MSQEPDLSLAAIDGSSRDSDQPSNEAERDSPRPTRKGAFVRGGLLTRSRSPDHRIEARLFKGIDLRNDTTVADAAEKTLLVATQQKRLVDYKVVKEVVKHKKLIYLVRTLHYLKDNQ